MFTDVSEQRTPFDLRVESKPSKWQALHPRRQHTSTDLRLTQVYEYYMSIESTNNLFIIKNVSHWTGYPPHQFYIYTGDNPFAFSSSPSPVRHLGGSTRFLWCWKWFARAGIATGYGLDGRGVGFRVPVERIFSSPRCADRLLGPSNLLSNVCRVFFLRG
jgi:hypothetical protein